MYNLDIIILEQIHSVQSRGLDQTALILTRLGGIVFIALVGLAIIITFMRQRHMRDAMFVALAIGGAEVLNLVLKLTFQRHRPSLWQTLTHEVTYSFPSGHAMGSSALAFTVIILLWRTRWRKLSLIVGSVYIITVGLTRLYLGVHFPSDIVAGWIVSLGWVVLMHTATYRKKLPRP